MSKWKIMALVALITFAFASGGIGNAVAGEREIIKFTGSPKLCPLYPPPPYLQIQGEHLLIVFEADEASIREVLPPELEPAADNTAGLNMYTVQNGVGLAPYTGTYIYVDVKGFDVDGTKGRWMTYGWYSPDRVMGAAREVLGLPVKLGTTQLKREANRIRAILTRDGVEVIEAEIKLKGESAGLHGGMLNYLAHRQLPAAHGTQAAVSELVVHRIPYMGEVFLAEPVSISFKVSEKDPLKKLEPKRLLGGVYLKNNSFVLGYADVVKEMR